MYRARLWAETMMVPVEEEALRTKPIVHSQLGSLRAAASLRPTFVSLETSVDRRSTLVSRAAPHKQKPRDAGVGLRPCHSSGGNTEREAAGWAGLLTLREFGAQLSCLYLFRFYI